MLEVGFGDEGPGVGLRYAGCSGWAGGGCGDEGVAGTDAAALLAVDGGNVTGYYWA